MDAMDGWEKFAKIMHSIAGVDASSLKKLFCDAFSEKDKSDLFPCHWQWKKKGVQMGNFYVKNDVYW